VEFQAFTERAIESPTPYKRGESTVRQIGKGVVVLLAVIFLGWSLAGDVGAQATKPRVTILYPNEGSVVPAGTVTVAMTVTGSTLVPADDAQNPKTGHFHLYLDKVPEHVGKPIPKGVDGIWHTGAKFFTMEKVTPGLHILVLVWAYGNHVPYSPWVTHTIMFEAK
jgi:hypothetical protein